jgi:hypothetical protein
MLVAQADLFTNELEIGHNVLDADRVLNRRSLALTGYRDHPLNIQDRVDWTELTVPAKHNLVRSKRQQRRGAVGAEWNQDPPIRCGFT